MKVEPSEYEDKQLDIKIIDTHSLETSNENLKRKHTDDNSASNDDDDSIKVSKPNLEDYDIFGRYVALELRSLKSDKNRRKLKSEIRKAIVRIADDDDNDLSN